MTSLRNITTDMNTIRSWAKSRNGKPAILLVKPKPQLRIAFPGKADEKLLSLGQKHKFITWDRFFKVFSDEKLVFIYTDEQTSDPILSFQFMKKENVSEEQNDDLVNQVKQAIVGKPDTISTDQAYKLRRVTPKDK